MTPLSVASNGYLDCMLSVATDGYLSCDGVIPPVTPPQNELDFTPTGRKLRFRRQREEEDALAFVASFVEMIDRES